MKIKQTLINIVLAGALVLGVAGCRENRETQLVPRADIPGTLEHYACWVYKGEGRDMNLMTAYMHSPARDQGVAKHHYFAKITQEK